MSNKITGCRVCGSEQLHLFLDLGNTPLADRILRKEQLQESEPVFPLEVAFCGDCSLVQILETVPPEILFAHDYPYYSSFSPALLKHSKENVLDIIKRRELNSDSFVMELASNDGYLLKNYVENGIPVLGIDPATGCAQAAEKVGVPTLNDFFTLELAKKLAAEGKQADIIHGNNVLAHVSDTNGFVQGIFALLKDDGMAVIEAPYVRDLIDHCEFDTIYHEHLCYLSVTALDHLFRRNGLYLNDIKRLTIHGGSLRLYVQKFEDVSDTVKNILKEEQQLGVDSLKYYQDFAVRVEKLKTDLLSMLEGLKAQGKSIAAYGAAAKGATLINYIGIGTQLVDYVVDRNTHKQNMYMPGQHQPILAPETLLETQPDYLLVLAWNFFEEISKQQSEYAKNGGKFIVPIPTPRIV